MKRLKVLLSSFACEPDKGSEQGVGWNLALEMANRHDVWVITRANQRQAIEAKLAQEPVPTLHFTYFDIPGWPQHWDYDNNKKLMELHYYLWQVGSHVVARRLHREVNFDVAQHATFVRYWMPSMLALLPVPFVWGPVGGGESAPESFYNEMSERNKRYETQRDIARWLGEHEPMVRLTARRSAIALATTRDTAARLNRLQAKDVRVLGEIGLQREEVERLGSTPLDMEGPMRFISMGRLLHWKGFHLGIRAFAQSGLEQAEYWVVGDGPEMENLQRLAEELGVARRVKFWGMLPRDETLSRLGESHALVHPSMHDSGGWVCMEAMASRRPVLCLDLGGPAYQVTPSTGFKIRPGSPNQAVEDLAEAMRMLASNREMCLRMGEEGHRRVLESFTWSKRADVLSDLYRVAIGESVARAKVPIDG